MQRVFVSRRRATVLARIRCRAGQGLVAEGVHRVHIVGQLTDIAAILELDALGHGNDDGRLGLLHMRSTFSTKWSTLKGTSGRQIMSTPSQSSALASAAAAVSQPAWRPIISTMVTTARVVDVRVADDFLHHDADVLGGAAVAGGVVGDHQVIVDGLGHAHKADVAADVCAVIGQLADGVHRVIAADVEEIADVQLLQNLKQLDVDGLALGGVPVGQLVAAGTQIAGRRALEKLNVQCGFQLIIQYAGAALQHARHAVQHTVDLACTAALAALIHARQDWR